MDCRTIIAATAFSLSLMSRLALPAWAQDENAAATDEYFETHVRPLLINRCLDCHSGEEPEGDLQLDSLAGMLAGGTRGPAIVPGDSAGSLLVLAINHAGQLDMPPRQKLPQEEIAILTDWITAGANWPGEQPTRPEAATPEEATITEEDRAFWSFQLVREYTIPEVANSEWCQSPIDHFILSRLEQAGLSPAPAADKRTLIRRATLDLIGLPPTPEEIADFLADDSPEAFAKVVDRLLASPRYGERWGRYWLDVARYADSNGLDENLAFANAWRYRDYVIDAFNADRPYDEFLREQIAGDLLPATDDPSIALRRVVATGFLSLGAKMLAEDDPVKMEMDIIDEQVDTLGRAVLGLTLGCARCHDHKFDPILMTDYYGLAGIFKSTTTMENFSVVARWQELPVAVPSEAERFEALRDQLAELNSSRKTLIDQESQTLLAEARQQLGDYLVEALRRDALDSIAASQPVSKVRLTEATVEHQILREADEFDRGNVQKNFDSYGESIGVLVNLGETPNFTEYDIVVPADGVYRFDIRLAAAGSRPVSLYVDGELQCTVADQVTGSWTPESQQWFSETLLTLSAGPHVLRLEQPEAFPHIDQFLLTPVTADSSQHAWLMELESQSAGRVGLHAQIIGNLRHELKDASQDAAHVLHPLAVLVHQGGAKDQAAGDSTFEQTLLAAGAFESPIGLAERYQSLAEQTLAESGDEANDAALQPLRDFLNAADGPFRFAEVPLSDAAKATVADLDTQIANIDADLKNAPMAMAVSEGTAQDLRMHYRGSHFTLGDIVPRRLPTVFVSAEQPAFTTEASGRLELADWLTNGEHPLTARVMVNRIWQMHFGHGLVRTPDNFGRLGGLPTHPELLDWLAARFVDSGWSIKEMHREILLSAAWQQSTQWNDEPAAVDPENKLLWRMNRHRMDAEALRDSILAVGGGLDLTMGGSLLPTANREYVTSTASINVEVYDNPRRTIYLPVVRSAVNDYLNAFDFGDPSVMRGQRDRTTIAPQALFLMNSSLAAEQSESLARRLLEIADESARVTALFETLYARPPEGQEITVCLDFVSERGQPTSELEAWKALCRAMMASNEFYFID
jgi:hypothetical protein